MKKLGFSALLILLTLGIGACGLPTDSGDEAPPKDDVDDGSGKAPVALVLTFEAPLG